MITENTLRIKLEATGSGDIKAVLGDVATQITAVDQAQQGAAASAQASAEAEKANATATQALGEAAGEAEARIKAMVQASMARAEAERATAEATQRSTATQASATVGLGRLVEAQNRAMAGATRMVQAEQQQASAAARAAGIEAQREELGKLVGQIDPTIAALEKLDQQQDKLNQFRQAGVLGVDDYKRFSAAIDDSRARINAAGEAMSHFSLNNATARRELGYIVKDLATGQWGRAQQSIMTLASSSGVLQLALSPVGAIVGTAAAALGLFAIAAGKGVVEAQALNNALILTGNYAGATSAQVRSMADEIGRGGSAALQLLAESGRVSGGRLQEAGQAAVDYAKVTGKSIAQASAVLVGLQDDPVRAVQELDKQLHFLTETQAENIRSLQDMGDVSTAAAIAQTALAQDVAAKAADQRQNLTLLGRSWYEVRDAIDAATEAAKRYGREAVYGTSNGDDVADANRKLAAIRSRSPQLSGLSDQQLLKGAQTPSDPNHALLAGDLGSIQLAVASKQRSAAGAWFEGLLASTSSDQQAANTALKSDDEFFDGLLKQAKSDSAKAKEIAAINSRTQRDIAAAPSRKDEFEQRQKEALAAVEKKYKAPGAAALDSASLQAMVDGYRNAQKQIDDVFTNSSRELQGNERAGLIDEADYYHQRIALIDDHAKKLSDALGKEADALRQRKATGAEQIRIEQQLADVEAKRRAVETDAASQRKQADNDHLTAQRKLLEINEQINLSLQTYQRSREQSASRQVDAIGHGSDYSQQAQILDQLRAQADARRDELTKQYRKQGGLDSPQYLQELQSINSWEQQQAAREVGYWQQRKDAMGNWANGARAALEDFQSHAQDVAGTVRDGFGSMFGGMEDAAVAWATGADVSLKSVEQDFEKTVARMAIQALEAQAISGLLGIFGGTGAFAGGGAGFSAASGGLGAYSGMDTGSFSSGFSLAGHADGGRINGPGTGTSDSVLARLSNGENVITAKATNYYGQRFMDDVNAMRLPRFADGGRVGGGSGAAAGSGAPIINITNNSSSEVSASARQQPDGRWITSLIIDTVAGDMASGGKIAKAGQQRFGWQRRGVPVSGV